MRLLMVEDEEKLAQLVKRALVAERFSVDVARDGREGLELATSYDYDLIVLDLLLPHMDGGEVLRRADGCSTTLRRYQTPGPDRPRREQVPFTLTHEALAKLVTDLTA